MIEIYTDGGCSGNPGPGAWAYAIIGSGELGMENGEPCLLMEKWGAEGSTTNNRMELQAVIAALEALSSTPSPPSSTPREDLPLIDVKPDELTIYTDSQYVQKGITIWIRDWKNKRWKTSSNEPVKNQDLWQRLDALTSALTTGFGLSVNWVWIKGHAGNEYNEHCDELVKKAIASF